MDQHKLLFGTLVKEITNLVIPNPLSTTIEALPILQRSNLYINDKLLGDNNTRMVKPVFLGNGIVHIVGPEWDSFVRDRGIRVGDVLLLTLVHQVTSPIIKINANLIRLNPQNNRTFVPLLPQEEEQQERNRQPQRQQGPQPILCVKRLSLEDVSNVVAHQIVMPKEILEVIMASGVNLDGNFLVTLKDQMIQNLEPMVVGLILKSDDGEVLIRYDGWLEFVKLRKLMVGDVVVFCFDFFRRTIITSVYRYCHQFGLCIPAFEGAQLNH
ncbi:hypothetical protein F8388_006312 [Cannabis sativa]|uniref:TF-B3 domain-containing protein n=1 Tax=Cannabis sativa TaxID=3483 RepID=A0A7J6EDN8_CANSA|nr:hypothetical protein F8388_006312 [Cannabis sativa]